MTECNCCDYRDNKKTWTRATTEKKIGNTLYLCRTKSTDQLWKRHTNQIWQALDKEGKEEVLDQNKEMEEFKRKRVSYNINKDPIVVNHETESQPSQRILSNRTQHH